MASSRNKIQYCHILLVSLLGAATTQQLPDYKYDYDFRPDEGITPTYKAALNKVLDCDTLLARYGPDHITPSVDQILSICTAKCHSSLVQFKRDLQKACPVESNIVHWPDGSNFTGTDNINEFMDRYNKLCLVDPDTGRFCYHLLNEWDSSGKEPTHEQKCSDCVLGMWQIQEESKAEYDKSFGSAVASFIDTCETTSVSLDILKGTPTAAATKGSGTGEGSVTAETSTETAPTASPEIPVLTPMPSGASTNAINLVSFIVPVLVLTSQWRWF